MQALDLTGEPFYIPATREELAGKSAEFKFRLNLYYVGLIVVEVIDAHHAKHKELPAIEKVRMPVEGIRLTRPNFVVEVFADESINYWPQIKRRDREFFLKNAGDVFNFLPPENKNALAVIFERNLISAEKEKDAWTYLLLLVKLAIKYMYRHLAGEKIVIRQIFGDGQVNPKARVFTREQLLALGKEYEVDFNK